MATTESAPPAAPSSGVTTPRYVPGAPPPAPPTKGKKKKNKSVLKNLAASAHEAALSDHAPDAEDIKAGKVDPSLLATTPAPPSSAPDTGNDTDADQPKATGETEKSLTVDAITKRIKALGKKVQRAKEYKDQVEALNPDQKLVVESLPSLEATIKELEGIKKSAEAFEATQRRTQNQQRAEERKSAEQRITEAAQHAEASLLPRITSLLSFLALRNLLVHATPSDISISEPERNAIVSAGDALIAHPPVGHVEEIVKGFLTGAGTWEDIEYSRLLEITSQFAAPRAPTPIPDPSIPLDPTTIEPEPEVEPEAEPEPEEPTEPEPEPEIKEEPEEPSVVLGLAQPATSGGGFHFMQESELDVPSTMTESQEWVSVPQPEDAVQSEEVAEEAEYVQEDVGFVGTEAGQSAATTGADAAGGAPLDWAAGEEGDELPDIGHLHATFGGSGSATPVPPKPTTAAPPASKSVTIDDDGFTAIPNRRGHTQRGSYSRGRGGFRSEGGEGYRGRGRGGFRGDGEGRGGFRGGEGGEGGFRGRGRGYRGDGEGRGGFRDGEGRGGYRNDGEGRGGFRGEGGEGGYRGGYRGERGERGEGGEGGEGGYRGRGRGGYRGDGERRGGYEGRGGYRGDRGDRRGSGFRGRGGSGPSTPAPETAGAA